LNVGDVVQIGEHLLTVVELDGDAALLSLTEVGSDAEPPPITLRPR
jgi:hypothetical protein